MNHGAPQFRLQGMENAKCALNRCVLDLWRVWVGFGSLLSLCRSARNAVRRIP
ncbi:hypothetical protein LMG24238_04237 [Paraburkholderia sediminicola]|uniref:Uncharacterized protein n=1 Tax=Paraburkholderia sediminicola TaxID=458836 RepID=A0A6J5BMG8_9BURK|nr:hypothetical protein LMG24238_04237 [Paraburkholderia sediminicola]